MLGEFNETAQPKTSLAKYSTEFNDLAVQMRPHRIAYLRLLGRPYTLLYVGRSVGRLGGGHHYSKVDLPRSKSNSQDTRWGLNSGRNSHSTLSNTIPRTNNRSPLRIRHNYFYLYLYGFQFQNHFRLNCQFVKFINFSL